MQVRRVVLHRKGEKLRDINRHLRLLIRLLKPLAVYKRVSSPNMLIGPQNSTLLVNPARARIRRAAEAAGRDPAEVTLVAVTKAQTAETVRVAATAGVTDFGENYLQEALPKMVELADLELKWHFIGGIQSNKTRTIAERFDWVHSIDRLNVGRRLEGERPFHAAPLNVCIQVELVPEPNKGGVAPGEVGPLAAAMAQLPRLCLRGVMWVAPGQAK